MRYVGLFFAIVICLCLSASSVIGTPFTEEALRISGIDNLPTTDSSSTMETSTGSKLQGEPASAGSEHAAADRSTAPVTTIPASQHVVVWGDTLSGLARRWLGDASRWRDLVQWNVDRYPSLAKNPNLILVGWNLRLAPPDAPGVVPADGSNVPTMIAAPLSASSASAASTAATATPTASAATPTASAGTTPSGRTEPGTTHIAADSRVLHIGDSHTVGVYGSSIDACMRETGAAVKTIGVAGSSPAWWFNGTVTRCGYYAKDENGRVDQPADWRTPRSTPNLEQILREYRPTHLVVSLGANMIGGSETAIKAQVKRMCEVAKAHGTTLIWVGPPRGREDCKPTDRLDRLYTAIEEVVREYGTFVDSRQYTNYPASGGDGLHYSGKEGTAIAKQWAGKVFDDIQH